MSVQSRPVRGVARGASGFAALVTPEEGRDGEQLRPVSMTIPMFAASSPFASLSGEALTALRGIAVRRSFADGQTIHMQDDEARFLSIIVAGHVRLSYTMEDGSTILLAVLPSGETVGEFGVFVQSAYPDTATAAGPVVLTSLPAPALLDLARSHPALSLVLARAVAAHYREYLALVRDLSLPSLPARLARTLIRLADRLNPDTDHGSHSARVIGDVVTQTDLGLMARGSRGNVNRTLQAWQRAGWIALRDRSIIVLSRSALAAVTTDR